MMRTLWIFTFLGGKLELRGLGTALFVVKKSPPSSGTCLEILESPR